MLNEIKMRCFLCAAETLSFTEAASCLYITQQGVSKHIAGLEREVGCRLFDRGHRRLALTPEGERLREAVAVFLGAYDGLLAENAAAAPAERTLRLGYLMGVDFGVEPIRAIERWKRENPGAAVVTQRREADELGRLLADGELDVIFTIERFRAPAEGLGLLRLRPVRMEVLVSQVDPRATDMSSYLDFVEEPMITENFASETQAESLARVRRDAAVMGLRPRRFITVPNRESAFAAAENGVGICLAPENSWNAASRHLRGYPLPYSDRLVCQWREVPRAARYAELAAREYAPGTEVEAEPR